MRPIWYKWQMRPIYKNGGCVQVEKTVGASHCMCNVYKI